MLFYTAMSKASWVATGWQQNNDKLRGKIKTLNSKLSISKCRAFLFSRWTLPQPPPPRPSRKCWFEFHSLGTLVYKPSLIVKIYICMLHAHHNQPCAIHKHNAPKAGNGSRIFCSLPLYECELFHRRIPTGYDYRLTISVWRVTEWIERR